MVKLSKMAWVLVVLVFFAVVSGVYELATANRRAHQARVEQVTRDANARIAREQAAEDRRKAAAALRATQPPTVNAGELAMQLCDQLRRAGATTCDTHFNVWSASYIDATFAVDPAQARVLCATAAQLTRVPGQPMLGWSLKLFSPLGQDRPMAVCNL